MGKILYQYKNMLPKKREFQKNLGNVIAKVGLCGSMIPWESEFRLKKDMEIVTSARNHIQKTGLLLRELYDRVEKFE